MKRKYFLIISITFITLLFFIIDELLLYINLGSDLLKINKSLPTISSDFYSNPTDNISYEDIIYKTRGDLSLTLDIYSPTKTINSPSPVIIYVFGDGWTSGTKSIPSEIMPIIDTLRDYGFTIVSTSYELMSDDIIFDNQVSDIKDTIRWIHKNSEKYNLNTNEIGIISPSAGAQLSMLAAFSDNASFIGDSELSSYSSDIKYIVNLFGPARLDKINLSAGPEELVSKLDSTKIISLSSKYSPINYLNSNLPNMLIIHSAIDEIVPYDTSVELYEKALLLGNNFDFFTLKESNHYLENLSSNEAFSLYLKIINYILSQTTL